MQEMVKKKARPQTLSKRVAALEGDAAELKRLIEQGAAVADRDLKGWVGLFKDDPGSDEVVKLGRAWRRQQPKC